MSFIIKRKIKNTTYVIEVTSYRDEQGRPRNKQKCLGKLDTDGVLISNNKYRKKFPAEIVRVRTIKTKYVVRPTKTKKEKDDKNKTDDSKS